MPDRSDVEGAPDTRRTRAPRVVIAGGGVAALEAMLALREHLDGHVKITLLAPEPDFVYRPLAVAEPFGLNEAKRFPLADIARDQSVRLTSASVTRVDPELRRVHTGAGGVIPYDALLIATGAIRREAVPGAVTFGDSADAAAVRSILDDAQAGLAARLAFVVPAGVSWALPLYELALMTAAHLRARDRKGVELTLITPEREPLGLFGMRASEAVARLLFERGIKLRTSTYASGVDNGSLRLVPEGELDVDRVISLPRLGGPSTAGLPHDEDGFIPTRMDGSVEGVENVFAAGDGTTFPVKQGGIAAQQADVAAATIARALGAAVPQAEFRPVLRGLLLTGSTPTYLRGELAGGAGDSSEASTETLWWPAAKIAGRLLAPYLASRQLLDREPLIDRAALEEGDPSEIEAEHRAAVELMLALADADADAGDLPAARAALAAAESLDGVLPTEYLDKRKAWEGGVR